MSDAAILETGRETDVEGSEVVRPSPEPRAARKPALPALTGIRTLLALNIVLFHFTPPYLGPMRPFVEHGYVFVNVFFLISGYILTYNYLDRATTLVKKEFWIARFSRLYPVYLLVLAVSFPMLMMEWQARSHLEFWQGLVLSPLLLQGWSPSLATFWNTVAWTLSCEVALYAAFPWLIRAPWTRRPSRLLAMIAVLWVIDLVPGLVYMYLNPDHLTAPVDRYTSTWLIRFLKYTPLPYATTFLTGVVLARLQLVTTISKKQRFAIAAVGLGLMIALFYLVVPKVPYLVMHGGLLLPVFATVVFGLSGDHPISSVFAWRPILLIGESTYCLYLLHFNVFNLIHMYHLPERLRVEALDPWISYAALIGLALLVYRFVENPARKAILGRFSSRKAA